MLIFVVIVFILFKLMALEIYFLIVCVLVSAGAVQNLFPLLAWQFPGGRIFCFCLCYPASSITLLAT